MTMPRLLLPSWWNAAAGLAIVLALTTLVYLPGLSGGFVFDDYTNIHARKAVQIESLSAESLRAAAFSGGAGPLKRPVAMLSFALDYYASGLDAPSFKRTSLIIHLLNGALVYLFVLQLFRSSGRVTLPDERTRQVALLTAAIWLLHPMALTSVLYVVQRMTSLAALFTLLSMLCYVTARGRAERGESYVGYLALCVVPLMPLAALSKETGLLTPLLLTTVEWCLFGRAGLSAARRRIVLGFHGLLTALPICLVLLYLAVNPDLILAPYDARPFSLGERVMTEARVLWRYLSMLVLPWPGFFGLYHDDLRVSTSLLQPVTTLPAVLGIVAGVLCLPRLYRSAPVAAFGLAFFLAGHGLESTVIALEPMFEHRNYLPSLGVLLCLAYYLVTLERAAALRVAAAGLFLSALMISSWIRASAWGDHASFTYWQYRNHPDSPRANTAFGALLLGEVHRIDATAPNFSRALAAFDHATALDPNYTEGLFSTVWAYSAAGLDVPAETFDELLNRLQNRLFHVQNINQIKALAHCHEVGLCKLPLAALRQIREAALRNPTMPPGMEAHLPVFDQPSLRR